MLKNSEKKFLLLQDNGFNTFLKLTKINQPLKIIP